MPSSNAERLSRRRASFDILKPLAEADPATWMWPFKLAAARLLEAECGVEPGTHTQHVSHETHVIVGDHTPEPRITSLYPQQGRVR